MSRLINTALDWLFEKESKSYRRKLMAVIVIIFVLSRILFFFAGLRFNVFPDTQQMHLISPDMFRNNLLESVFFLHAQPPLFNLFIGIILMLFPVNSIPVFHFIYMVIGLMFMLSLFLLMTRLGVSGKISAVLTVLFIVSPPVIQFENILYYTYPVVTFLCMAALFLHRFLGSARLRDGFIFFTLMSLVVLTRSLFHIAWFYLIFSVLLFFMRHEWKRIILVSCIPMLLVTFSYGKNLYVFGSFSNSSWLGMNISRITTLMLPEDERILLTAQGKISELSLIRPFSGIWVYRDKGYKSKSVKTNIPVLDQEYYPSGGNNYNNIEYPRLSKQYLKDAIYIVLHCPHEYMEGLSRSFRNYFFPTSDWFAMFWQLLGNREKILYLEKFYNFVIFGQVFNYNDPTLQKGYYHEEYSQYFAKIGFFILIGFCTGVCYCIRLMLKAFFKKPVNTACALTLLFFLINIAYVTVIGNFLEVGENQRFRFNIDPFILTIVGLFLHNGLKKVYTKRKRMRNSKDHSSAGHKASGKSGRAKK